jgi:hypothetical protein
VSELEYLALTPVYELVTVEGVTYYTTPNGKNDFSEEKNALIRLHTPPKAVVVKPKALPAPVAEPNNKRKKSAS